MEGAIQAFVSAHKQKGITRKQANAQSKAKTEMMNAEIESRREEIRAYMEQTGQTCLRSPDGHGYVVLEEKVKWPKIEPDGCGKLLEAWMTVRGVQFTKKDTDHFIAFVKHQLSEGCSKTKQVRFSENKPVGLFLNGPSTT